MQFQNGPVGFLFYCSVYYDINIYFHKPKLSLVIIIKDKCLFV